MIYHSLFCSETLHYVGKPEQVIVENSCSMYEYDRMVPRRRFEYDVVRNKFVRRARPDPLSYGGHGAGRPPSLQLFLSLELCFVLPLFFEYEMHGVPCPVACRTVSWYMSYS